MAARVTIVDTMDGQAIYLGTSLYKQDETTLLDSQELCSLFDMMEISVNLISGDEQVQAFIDEHGMLPEKLSELQQIINGK